MSDLPPLDNSAMRAEIVRLTEFIGRNGARSLDIGYDGDDDDARWYVRADFKGGHLGVEGHIGPLQALRAFVAKLQEGARCAHCSRVIAWGLTTSRTKCPFYLDEEKNWRPGCLRDAPTVLVEHGNEPARGVGTLPPKKRGEHRWIATAGHYLTEEQAGGAETAILDHENRFTFGVGCVDCEQEFSVAQGTPCPAGDTWDAPEPVPPVTTDPKEASTTAAPAGTKVMDPSSVAHSVLLHSVGVQVLRIGRVADPDNTGIVLALSLAGRQNKSPAELHHLYMVAPDMAGLLMAQVMSVAGALGKDFVDGYNDRIAELKAEGILGPNPFQEETP